MTYAYLCVDSTGAEYICGDLPERVKDDDIYGGDVEYWFSDNMIEIPIGTIKKLIGKEITWIDEPERLEA